MKRLFIIQLLYTAGFLLLLMLLFAAYQIIHQRNEYLISLRNYFKELETHSETKDSSCFTANIFSNIERDFEYNPELQMQLNNFKKDTLHYPANVFLCINKHIRQRVARTFVIPKMEEKYLCVTLFHQPSNHFEFQLYFRTENNQMKLDSVSNLYKYFSYLNCLEQKFQKENNKVSAAQ